MSSKTAQPFVLRGGHVLALIVGFFALVIAVDVSFAVMAYRTDPGQVVATPYEDGLAFNTAIARRDLERRLGWRAAVASAPDRVGSRLLTVTLVDRDGKPVRRLKLAGAIARPATETGARKLAFAETRPGVYQAGAPDAPGAWDLSLSATSPDGLPFEADARLVWR